MKAQQIAVYESLNEFMVAVGYQNAADRREDDPVWSTLNDNNFKAMMEYKFGVEPRFIAVPTKLEAVHEGITSHEAWVYHEDLEHDDGEEAPVPLHAVATAPEGGEPDDSEGGQPLTPQGEQDDGEGTGEPASTEQKPEGTPPADEPPAVPPVDEQAPATEEKPADDGGGFEQE